MEDSVDKGDLLEGEDCWGVLQGLGAVPTLEVRVLAWARAVPTTDHLWETVRLPPSVALPSSEGEEEKEDISSNIVSLQTKKGSQDTHNNKPTN
jgi:hypothetical protein